MQHVEFLTKQRKELTFRLGNAEIVSKLHIDIRANQLFYHSKCLKTKISNIIMNKSRRAILTKLSKKRVHLKVQENTQEKAHENPECSVVARVILKIHKRYLTNQNLLQVSNKTCFR